MRGYQLAERLRQEANEVAVEERAQLLRDAATEIENLIKENRELADKAKGEETENEKLIDKLADFLERCEPLQRKE